MDFTPLYDDETSPSVISLVQAEENDSDPRDVDLEATLQFVAGASTAVFDFSAFLYVVSDGSNKQAERERIQREIDAVNRLADAVHEFHVAYLNAASVALERVEALQ